MLSEHGITYVERGANVKRGEINIQCPFCGSADPSQHMGLNLETGYWACWRNQDHRGKSPLRLLTRLLGISYTRARQIAGMDPNAPADPDGFDAVAARVMGRNKDIAHPDHVRREFLAFPQEFAALRHTGGSQRHWNYLLDRKFDPGGIAVLQQFYNVRAALYGPYKDRVILPYYMDEKLVAWTGRAIGPAEIRYKDLPLDECLVPIKEVLFNYDTMAAGGRALVVVEGPIDALKLEVYGYDDGIRAVALSTNSISNEQVYMLEELCFGFNRVIVMMDNASELGVVDSMRMKQLLRGVPNLHIMPVPFGCKDAGELTPIQAASFAEDLARSISREI